MLCLKSWPDFFTVVFPDPLVNSSASIKVVAKMLGVSKLPQPLAVGVEDANLSANTCTLLPK